LTRPSVAVASPPAWKGGNSQPNMSTLVTAALPVLHVHRCGT
jgi:hypothetical protein